MRPHSRKQKPAIHSAMVIDNTILGQAAAKKYLTKLGVTNISLVENQESAKHELYKHQFDILVLDWDQPEQQAVCLFNCVRRRAQYAAAPILITGWKLQPSDLQILSEFPVTGLLQKPFTEQTFLLECTKLIAESNSLDQNRHMIEKLLNSADDTQTNPVKLARKICTRLKNPTAVLVHTSRSLSVAGKLKAAKSVLEAGLSTDAYKLPLYTELGRINLLEGNNESAIQLLRHAQSFSSGNLERVLMLGELELKYQHPRRAREYFDQALSLDRDDPDAIRGRQIAQRMEEYFSRNDLRDIPKSFVSTMNAIAIGLVRTRNFRDAVDQYQGAHKMASCEEDAQRVAFNLGLLYLRWKKMTEALPWFHLATPIGGEIAKKANHYIHCIEYRSANEDAKAAELASKALEDQESSAAPQ